MLLRRFPRGVGVGVLLKSGILARRGEAIYLLGDEDLQAIAASISVKGGGFAKTASD